MLEVSRIAMRKTNGGVLGANRKAALPVSASRAAALALLLALVLFSAGCATAKREPAFSGKIAVLDFKVPPDFGKTDDGVSEKGWWFGSRRVHENRRIGVLLADKIFYALPAFPDLTPYPRADLQKYFLKKRDQLVKAFPGRGTEDYDKLMQSVSVPDYGTDLGMRYVITGEVFEARTSFNYFFALWFSIVRARVDLWDIAEGRIVWTREFTEDPFLGTQATAMRRLTANVIDALKKDLPPRWWAVSWS